MATTAQINSFLNAIHAACVTGWTTYQILPSLTAAQAALESSWGTSGLATKGNNLFGIKGSYNGQYVTYPTTEYVNGQAVIVNANFRKYPSWGASITDHGTLLSTNSRYSNIVGNTDYQSACNDIQSDGYATDPNYASKLITTINAHNMAAWDDEAINNTPTPTPINPNDELTLTEDSFSRLADFPYHPSDDSYSKHAVQYAQIDYQNKQIYCSQEYEGQYIHSGDVEAGIESYRITKLDWNGNRVDQMNAIRGGHGAMFGIEHVGTSIYIWSPYRDVANNDWWLVRYPYNAKANTNNSSNGHIDWGDSSIQKLCLFEGDGITGGTKRCNLDERNGYVLIADGGSAANPLKFYVITKNNILNGNWQPDYEVDAGDLGYVSGTQVFQSACFDFPYLYFCSGQGDGNASDPPTMYCVDVINNKLIYNIAYQFNKTISKERPYPEPETISFYYGSDGKRTLVQGFNMSSGSNYSGPLYIAQEEGQENDGDSDYSSVPNVSDLLIRTNTIEEILVDYDYEGFQYQVRTNEIDQIGFTIYRTDRNEELFDLIESQVELINSGKIYIVHQCTPHLEGATATKEIVATEITFECQNEVYQYSSKESVEDSNGNKKIPSYTISEVMHFFFDGSDYKWTVYGSFDPQPIETLGPGDGLSCLQDIIVKIFGAQLWMANKEIRIYTNDQYQSQTDNVIRWKFNTDNFQVQIDDTGIKNSAMCYGKQDDNENYSFPPFQYRDEISIAVWGERKADAISNSDIDNVADMQTYTALQLQVDPAISVTLDYQGNEGFSTGQVWHLIMELLNYETDIEIIGFTSYPHGHSKPQMEFSNGVKDMLGLYQQMMRRIRAIEGRRSA